MICSVDEDESRKGDQAVGDLSKDHTNQRSHSFSKGFVRPWQRLSTLSAWQQRLQGTNHVIGAGDIDKAPQKNQCGKHKNRCCQSIKFKISNRQAEHSFSQDSARHKSTAGRSILHISSIKNTMRYLQPQEQSGNYEGPMNSRHEG